MAGKGKLHSSLTKVCSEAGRVGWPMKAEECHRESSLWAEAIQGDF